MRKKAFVLSTTIAAALAVSACQRNSYDDYDGYRAQRDTAVCVDRKTQRRMSDDYCRRGRTAGAGNAFMWYYLGRNSTLPFHGDTVRGGSFTRTAGATYFHAPASTNVSRAVAVSRGGFGSSAHGSVGS